LNPNDVHNKDEEQYAENKKEGPKKCFDDIPIKYFHGGKSN